MNLNEYNLGESILVPVVVNRCESFQLQMGFSFPFLRANDLGLSLLNIRARSFLLSCTKGYIRKVSIQLVQKCFSRVCSTDSISCSERKNWKKRRIKQGSKTKEGKVKRCCCRQSTWLIIALLSNCYCSAIAPLSHQYRYAVALLSLRCRHAIAPLCSAVATPLLLWCRAAVTPLSHRYCSTVDPLLSLLLSLRSCTAIAPLSRRCRNALSPAQRGYK